MGAKALGCQVGGQKNFCPYLMLWHCTPPPMLQGLPVILLQGSATCHWGGTMPMLAVWLASGLFCRAWRAASFSERRNCAIGVELCHWCGSASLAARTGWAVEKGSGSGFRAGGGWTVEGKAPVVVQSQPWLECPSLHKRRERDIMEIMTAVPSCQCKYFQWIFCTLGAALEGLPPGTKEETGPSGKSSWQMAKKMIP